uniref:SEA domain-containing protein n=1 Tax=Onchocerca volvulus TaxID=6282 RepID=A0A8R1U0I7_ONCVO
MRSEILIYSLVSLLSAIAQNVESENSTVEEATSSLSSSSLPVPLKSNSKSETHEQNSATQTTASRKKGFSIPQIKRARELGAPNFSIFDQESTLPFITETDRSSTTEVQSDHPKYQNVTHEEKRDNYETKKTSTSGSTEIPKVSSMIESTRISDDKIDIITKMSEHIGNEDGTLPPEIMAEDPFATTTTEATVSTLLPSQENIPLNPLFTSSFLNNSDVMLSEEADADQTSAFDRIFDTDAKEKIFSTIASSEEPEQETVITGTTNGIQEMLQETKVTVSEEQDTTVASETIIMETVPDISRTSTANIVTSVEQKTVTESVPIETISSIILPESVFHSSSSQESDDAFVTESRNTASAEIEEHKSEVPNISITSTELPLTTSTTNEFSTDKSHENEDDEHVHDDENLFVGDKTLFIQDGIVKHDFSVMHLASRFTTPPSETSEENFGVPGFSRIERLGPEATEEIQQTEIDDATSTIQSSLNTESEVRAGIPDDLTKHSQERHDDEHISTERPQTTWNSFEESDEIKDISMVDDSVYSQTDIEEATLRPTTDERKLEPESIPQPEPTPEPVPFPESEVFESAKTSPKPVTSFEPKAEPEIITEAEVKNGGYKTPFSFRITSIDYIPEFGDPSSGKYKKLRDQLLPDLEEIFGSIFGHIYEGVHLVSFLKGSVMVDGIVYTSTKPDDLEQSATELEKQITAKNSQIGGNDVDPRSIVLDGYVSKNYVERIHEGYTSDNTYSYIVGSAIGISILAILLIAFIVIAMNNRRTNGTLKFKEENIAMAESNRSMWPNGTSPVNLMAYGNDRVTRGGTTSNTQPPMVMIGSQMTAMNTHTAARTMQPGA